MIQRIKEKLNLQTVIRLIPTILFLGFIFVVTIQLFLNDTIRLFIRGTELSSAGIELFSDTFEEKLQENFYDKNDFIDLNGLTTRALGINSLNERQKLANGYLANFGNAGDTTEPAVNVIALNQFLDDRDIEFIYLLAPTKNAFYDAEFAPGYGSTAWMNIDSMISSLDEAGVTTIDMDAWFEENGWTMEDVYFKTDHHWRPQAGLAAANVTMELLAKQGLADYQEELLQEDSYTVDTLKDWFLGSDGKRVGRFYTSVDNIDVFYPNFATGYTLSGLDTDTTNWNYWDSLINLSLTENKDYYNTDPHCIYFYRNQPIQIITNTEASNDKRVLITGDSFHRMWKYFLATQFQEIYSVDLRYYTDGTLTEFIEEIQPDIVMMCTCSATSMDYYTFHVDEYLAALEQTSLGEYSAVNLGDAEITGQGNNDHFSVMTTDLEPNQAYTLTADATSYSGGEDLYIQMTLQDLSTNTAVYNRYFDANSNNKQKWIFTVPNNSNDTYSIYLYAGTKGHTEGVSIEVSNIELQKGIIEN